MEELHSACSERFKQKFPDFAKCMPEDVCYYSSQSQAQIKIVKGIEPGPFDDNYFPVLHTGKLPHWRPSK